MEKKKNLTSYTSYQKKTGALSVAGKAFHRSSTAYSANGNAAVALRYKTQQVSGEMNIFTKNKRITGNSAALQLLYVMLV